MSDTRKVEEWYDVISRYFRLACERRNNDLVDSYEDVLKKMDQKLADLGEE